MNQPQGRPVEPSDWMQQLDETTSLDADLISLLGIDERD